MANKIHGQISAIMAEVRAVGKTHKNDGQGGFMYRKIDDVVDMLHPIFAKHKVFILPEAIEDKTENRQTSRGATLIYRIIKVKITYVSGEDGSSLSSTVVGEGMDSGDKAANKAMTAALKYSLSQTFLLPFAMVDADGHTPPESVKFEQATAEALTPAAPVSKSDLSTKLIEQMSQDGISNGKMLEYCRGKNWLTADQRITDLPEPVMSAMLVPENWAKVKTSLSKPESKSEVKAPDPVPVKPDQFAFNSKLYDLMTLSGVANDELKKYLTGKGFITATQSIDNLPEKFVNQMITEENWDKIVGAIKKARV